jgi:hypothetical protein
MQKNEMQIFFFNESYIRDAQEVQFSSQKHPIPKCNFLNATYLSTLDNKNNATIFLCLILIQCKSFNNPLLSIKIEEPNGDTNDTKPKGFQPKHALTG